MPLYPEDDGKVTQSASITLDTLSVGTTEIVINWPINFSSATYATTCFIEAGTASVGKMEPRLKPGSRTVAQCVITVTNSMVVAIAAGSILHVIAHG